MDQILFKPSNYENLKTLILKTLNFLYTNRIN
jgi:hypothetical protein